MLRSTIGDLLPMAVAVALSPIPIIGVVLVLGTPRAKVSGPAFALGWVLGLSAVTVLVLALARGASDPDSGTQSGINWMKVALGVLFLVMAFRQWRKRPRRGEPHEMPKWMATLDNVDAPKALGLGVALSALNPKNLALTLAAAGTIAQAGLDRTDETIAAAVFVVIASVTVAGAVIFYLLAGARAERPLAALRQFMTDHNAAIMTTVLIVIGMSLLGNGIGSV